MVVPLHELGEGEQRQQDLGRRRRGDKGRLPNHLGGSRRVSASLGGAKPPRAMRLSPHISPDLAISPASSDATSDARAVPSSSAQQARKATWKRRLASGGCICATGAHARSAGAGDSRSSSTLRGGVEKAQGAALVRAAETTAAASRPRVGSSTRASRPTAEGVRERSRSGPRGGPPTPPCPRPSLLGGARARLPQPRQRALLDGQLLRPRLHPKYSLPLAESLPTSRRISPYGSPSVARLAATRRATSGATPRRARACRWRGRRAPAARSAARRGRARRAAAAPEARRASE